MKKVNIPFLRSVALAAALTIPSAAAACSMEKGNNIPVDTETKVCLDMGSDHANDQALKLQYSFEALHDLDQRSILDREEAVEVLRMKLDETNAVWEDLSSNEKSCITKAASELSDVSQLAKSEIDADGNSPLARSIYEFKHSTEIDGHTTTTR